MTGQRKCIGCGGPTGHRGERCTPCHTAALLRGREVPVDYLWPSISYRLIVPEEPRPSTSDSYFERF